jgi:hypothetical protein
MSSRPAYTLKPCLKTQPKQQQKIPTSTTFIQEELEMMYLIMTTVALS